ncbi:MAG TPA: cellulase family glycosylhydrolase [Chloroflexota bacterium]|nr:cellulase family glycosylhydrolase [Chloroflexota bacterium]
MTGRVAILVAVVLVALSSLAAFKSGTELPGTFWPASAQTVAPGAGYWHTRGTTILDASNRPVRLAAVTWYGMESSYWVPAGLDYQKYTAIMDEVKRLGFNTIRLPFSNELVETNPVVARAVNANPQLRGKHAMTVMDDIIAYAGRIGLKIILDDQRSRAGRPLEVNNLDEALWYTKQYPESAWIADWQNLARRYRGNATVVGFDLRNEPHTQGPGPWNVHAYLSQGATWGPYRGADNVRTDWRLAAERGGNAALAINPHLLMFVEGIQTYPDSSQPAGLDSYFWSGILTPARRYPVVFKVPHQLVYEAHDWGPWKWEMPWFKHMTYASVASVWHRHWSFVVDNAAASFAAPLFLGEFGTCTNNPQCVDVQKPDNQAMWFHFLLRFLAAHPQVGWSFFALNGSNSNDSAANNGILNTRWDGVSNRALVADLQTIQH